MPKEIQVPIGAIFESNNCGKFEVVEDFGHCCYGGVKNPRRYVKIHFLKTGGETVVGWDHVKKGSVKDPLYGFDPNRVFQSLRSGPFKMIEHLGTDGEHSIIRIQFINTGTIVQGQLGNILNGNVSDPALNGAVSPDYDITRFANYETRMNLNLTNIYSFMMYRCYNTNADNYDRYGGLGVTVCERWRNSKEAFIEDAKKLDGYDKYYHNPNNYCLDKDYKQQDTPRAKRVYSPETCMFISRKDNTNLAMIEQAKRDPNFRYHGVRYQSGIFTVSRKINGKNIYLGGYNNEIAAANLNNYVEQHFHEYDIIPLFNDVPYMSYEEFTKYNVSKTPMDQESFDKWLDSLKQQPAPTTADVKQVEAPMAAWQPVWPNPYSCAFTPEMAADTYMCAPMPTYETTWQPIVYW